MFAFSPERLGVESYGQVDCGCLLQDAFGLVIVGGGVRKTEEGAGAQHLFQLLGAHADEGSKDFRCDSNIKGDVVLPTSTPSPAAS